MTMANKKLNDWENAPQSRSVIGGKKKGVPEPLKVFVRWNCDVKGKFESVETECFYCGEPLNKQNRTKDHVRPRSKGYTLRRNKVYACMICNIDKSSKTLREWRERLLQMNPANASGEQKYIYLLNRRNRIIEKLNLMISKIWNA